MSDTCLLQCGEGRLDLERLRLLDGRGHELPLRNKSFELLCILLARAGRVVTRAELLDLVWDGVHVTDDSITQCVVEIRRQLRYVGGVELKTVQRRGYVLELSARARPAPLLAVGQFDGLDGGATTVAKVIARELRVDLARSGTLRIVGDGGEARPDLTLCGLVQSAGGRLRVTAELLEARSAAVLWAGRFDAANDDADPLQTQAALALRIAEDVCRAAGG